MRIILGCLFALALMTPAPALSQASASRYQVPAVRDDGWKNANADAVGVDSTKLAGLTTAIRARPELGVQVGLSQYRNAVASGPLDCRLTICDCQLAHSGVRSVPPGGSRWADTLSFKSCATLPNSQL